MKKKCANSIIRLFVTFLVASGGLFSYFHVDRDVITKLSVMDSTPQIVEMEEVPEVVEEVKEEPVEIPETSEVPVVQQPAPASAPVVYTPPVIVGDSIEVAGITRNLMKDDTGEHFYLNHNLNGEYDGIGVPYVDFRHDFTGRKTIIYSHSSKAGNGPFQALQNYHNNPGFYSGHRMITIHYQGKTYNYEIFSVYVSVADSEESSGLEYFHRMNYSDSEWEETIQWYKNNSEYDTGVSVNGNDQILILQTCSMDPNYYARYYRYNLLIMGKLV